MDKKEKQIMRDVFADADDDLLALLLQRAIITVQDKKEKEREKENEKDNEL